MRFYAPIQLGEKRFRTDEGFLVCLDVPIARTGQQIYNHDEVPEDLVDDESPVYVDRSVQEVFREETIASINGKPFVNEHPEEDGERVDVTPDNFSRFIKGVMFNGRRGEADQEQELLADLVVYDPETIAEIEQGKRELSCGYDADFSKTGFNRGEQVNIVMNHLALVASGRCGPRCAIGDRKEDKPMKRNGVMSYLTRAFKAKTADELAEIAEEMDQKTGVRDDEGIHLHMHGGEGEKAVGGGPETLDKTPPWFSAYQEQCDARFDALEGALTKWAAQEENEPEHQDENPNPGEEGDPTESGSDITEDGDEEENEEEKDKKASDRRGRDKKKGRDMKARKKPSTRDSTHLHDTWQDTVALATLLVPTIQAPTFDSSARSETTINELYRFRRSALELAAATPEGHALISNHLGNQRLGDVLNDRGKVRDTFKAVGLAARAVNNARLTGSNSRHPRIDAGAGGLTLQQYAQNVRKFYTKDKKATA